MKRLIPLLLLIPTLAFGMGRRPPANPTPTSTSTLDLATGQLTTSDYSGQSQSAAGNSRIADTGASTVGGKFADKSDPTMELAWFDINRAAEDQPDVAIDLQLANEHKSAVESLKSLTAGGNPSVAALNLATEGLKVVKDKIAAREREKAARGKADTSAFRATAYLQGPGAVTSVAVMAGTMGAAVANGNEKRATFTSDINSKVTDTTNTNDWQGANAVLKTQLEMTKLELEIARLKNAVKPTTSPVVKPTEPKPEDPATPEIPGQSPEARHKSLYPHVQLTGGNVGTATNHTLWKPGADQGADGLVIVTQHNLPKVRSLTILKGGETVKRMSIDDVVTAGNGYRLNWRFGGRGYSGAHTVVADTVDGQFSVQIPDGNKRADNLQMKKTSTGPVDPPPTTSSLFILEPDKLTLRPDFAAVVRKIDALANVNEPNTDPVFITAGKVGTYTWGIPKPLGSYPKGALPNTWRISLLPGVKIPDDVTYHRSIMQSFIQDGATKTYPPTTRE